MACDFSVVLNAGASADQLASASEALELVGELEAQMSVYREDSELNELNRTAASAAVRVESELFHLLQSALELGRTTYGAFDPTSGPLVALWRSRRDQGLIPTQEEIERCLEVVGFDKVNACEEDRTLSFSRTGVELNLGGIGKGYALDRAGSLLATEKATRMEHWLLHGGRSSVLCRGVHNDLAGWPVGIGNPLFPGKRLGTILLRDCAMATSGSNIQYFRHRGRRYGHILDPRTGWPVESMLSVTVVAPTAAEADALSTAFYVMGVEKTLEWCDNREGVGAVVIPPPAGGRDLHPMVTGIPDEWLFWNQDQLAK